MYIVIELQKTGDQIAHIVTEHEARNEAESKFYSIMAAAAVSSVPIHAASIIDEHGMCIKDGFYEHTQEET